MKLNLDFYKEDICIFDEKLYTKYLPYIENIINEDVNSSYDQNIGQNLSVFTFNSISKIRRNVLDWINFDKDSDFLEIGTEFGVITEMLCEKVKSVTSVAFSKKDIEIAKKILEKYENLEVIVGKLDDIKISKKFDYISIIGCMESLKKIFSRNT